MDLATGEGKQRALNFLLPYIQKIPNGIMRSEWATRIAQQLRIDEPLLRSALSKAAKERRGQIYDPSCWIWPERAAKLLVERRLIRMLAESARLPGRSSPNICKMPTCITGWRRRKFLRRW